MILRSGLGRRGDEWLVFEIILYLTLMASEEHLHLLPPGFFPCFNSIVMKGKDLFFFFSDLQWEIISL